MNYEVSRNILLIRWCSGKILRALVLFLPYFSLRTCFLIFFLVSQTCGSKFGSNYTEDPEHDEDEKDNEDFNGFALTLLPRKCIGSF